MISRKDLEAITEAGLASDIFRAERAIALLQVSGTRADEINNGEGNFGELFGAFQTALTTEATLAVARLYDQPSPRYPTRCLVGVLNFLAEHNEELPSIREPHQVGVALLTMNPPHALLTLAEEGSATFGRGFAAFVLELLCAPARKQNIQRLKQLRDKSLAHNEHVAAIDAPTWNALIDLVDLAKQVVGVLGWAYFSTAYTINGEYLMSEDAQRASRALSRLLNVLYVPAAT